MGKNYKKFLIDLFESQIELNEAQEDYLEKRLFIEFNSGLGVEKFNTQNIAIYELEELGNQRAINPQALDLLMEEASISVPKNFKETPSYEQTNTQKHSKGNSQTPSKKEKHQLAKLKKLK